MEAPCHDLGVVAWLVRRELVPSVYAYFVLLNSSVRGPFLPPYAQVRPHGTAQSCPLCWTRHVCCVLRS